MDCFQPLRDKRIPLLAQKMKLRPHPMALLQMAAYASALVLQSCDDKSTSSGSTLSRGETKELFNVLTHAEKFKARAIERFSSEGIEFSVMHSSGGSQDVAAITEGPTFLICKGLTDEQQILDFDVRFREAFTEEEIADVQIKYQIFESGNTTRWISAVTIRSRIESKNANKARLDNPLPRLESEIEPE